MVALSSPQRRKSRGAAQDSNNARPPILAGMVHQPVQKTYTVVNSNYSCPLQNKPTVGNANDTNIVTNACRRSVSLTSFLRHVHLDGPIEQLARSLHLGVISMHAVLLLAGDVAVKRLRHELRIVVSLLTRGITNSAATPSSIRH